MVAHTPIPSTQVVEAGGFLEVPDQCDLHRKHRSFGFIQSGPVPEKNKRRRRGGGNVLSSVPLKGVEN